jgi:hypothetical protein
LLNLALATTRAVPGAVTTAAPAAGQCTAGRCQADGLATGCHLLGTTLTGTGGGSGAAGALEDAPLLAAPGGAIADVSGTARASTIADAVRRLHA